MYVLSRGSSSLKKVQRRSIPFQCWTSRLEAATMSALEKLGSPGVQEVFLCVVAAEGLVTAFRGTKEATSDSVRTMQSANATYASAGSATSLALACGASPAKAVSAGVGVVFLRSSFDMLTGRRSPFYGNILATVACVCNAASRGAYSSSLLYGISANYSLNALLFTMMPVAPAIECFGPGTDAGVPLNELRLDIDLRVATQTVGAMIGFSAATSLLFLSDSTSPTTAITGGLLVRLGYHIWKFEGGMFDAQNIATQSLNPVASVLRGMAAPIRSEAVVVLSSLAVVGIAIATREKKAWQ
jgi:hypothetical protein